MAKDGFIKCEYYLNEGNCSKGREGTFYHSCQHCDLYKAVRGAAPAKKNLKKQKLQKAKESAAKDCY